MKTAHILSLTAVGAVGSLLLGGGAFATGVAIGSDARDNRVEQGEQRAHDRKEQAHAGQGKPGGATRYSNQGSSDRFGDNHPGGKTRHGSGESRQENQPSTQRGTQFGPGAGAGTMSAPDNLGMTSGGL